MPSAGKVWRHVILNTRCAWLPGSAKGFRNRRHRIHSSGDYKNPPPPSEHAGLRRYFETRAAKPIILRRSLRRAIALALRDRFAKEGHRCLVVAVARVHAHALVELPDDRAEIRLIVGRCKRAACVAVSAELPGKIWGSAGEFRRVKDRSHHENAYFYVRDDQGPSAWVWTFRDGEMGFTRAPDTARKARKKRQR